MFSITEEYKDTGCELYPRCLECPLSLCRFEVKVSAQERRQQMLECVGLTAKQAAQKLGVSRQHVYQLRKRFGLVESGRQTGTNRIRSA